VTACCLAFLSPTLWLVRLLTSLLGHLLQQSPRSSAWHTAVPCHKHFIKSSTIMTTRTMPGPCLPPVSCQSPPHSSVSEHHPLVFASAVLDIWGPSPSGQLGTSSSSLPVQMLAVPASAHACIPNPTVQHPLVCEPEGSCPPSLCFPCTW
jgi:hypothetical protein